MSRPEWQPLGTVIADASGTGIVDQTPSEPMRFYRSVLP
jgi:hypothetical protein